MTFLSENYLPSLNFLFLNVFYFQILLSSIISTTLGLSILTLLVQEFPSLCPYALDSPVRSISPCLLFYGLLQSIANAHVCCVSDVLLTRGLTHLCTCLQLFATVAELANCDRWATKLKMFTMLFLKSFFVLTVSVLY